MYAVLIVSDTKIPVIRRWVSQMVVMGAFVFQFQAWRRRRVSRWKFILGRFRVIGFYVFLFCFAGYTVVTLNYFLDEGIPLLVGGSLAWAAFFLGLADVFIQLNSFTFPTN